MRSVTPAWLLIAACSIVDETGYLCADGTRAADPSACAEFAGEDVGPDSEAPPEDDAAGGGSPTERVAWTAEVDPTGVPGPVFLVGYAGANPGQLAVTASVAGQAYEAAEAGTAFVVVVMAAAGDVVTLSAGGDSLGEVSITGGLRATVSEVGMAPEAALGDEIDGPPAPGEAVAVAVPVGDAGYVTDTVLFSPTRGDVIAVGQGTASVTVDASDGDRVCLAEDDGVSLSVAWCRDVVLE